MKTAQEIKKTLVETRPTVHRTISCSPNGSRAEIVIETPSGVATRHVVWQKANIFKWSRFEQVFETRTETKYDLDLELDVEIEVQVLVEMIEHRELYTLNLKG